MVFPTSLILLLVISGAIGFWYTKKPDWILAVATLCATIPFWLSGVLTHSTSGSKLLFFSIVLSLPISLVLVPLLTLVELIWIGYFVLKPGTLFNFEQRRKAGMPFTRLIPHIVALAVVALTYFCWDFLKVNELMMGLGGI